MDNCRVMVIKTETQDTILDYNCLTKKVLILIWIQICTFLYFQSFSIPHLCIKSVISLSNCSSCSYWAQGHSFLLHRKENGSGHFKKYPDGVLETGKKKKCKTMDSTRTKRAPSWLRSGRGGALSAAFHKKSTFILAGLVSRVSQADLRPSLPP